MNTIKEKKMLVNMARALGQEPDPLMVQEIELFEKFSNVEKPTISVSKTEFKSVIDSISSELSQLMKEEKARTDKEKEMLNNFSLFMDNVHTNAEKIVEAVEVIEDVTLNEIVESVAAVKEAVEEPTIPSTIDSVVNQISSTKPPSMFVEPDPPLVSKEISDIQRKIKLLEGWLSKVSMAGPGSGEVNFRYLDDVARSTMTPSNDNWVLEYDAASKKVQFTTDIGPIQTVTYDPTHVDTHTTEGTTAWSNKDLTLNIHHPGGVVQQVGQEQYMLVRNLTGNTILNGTCVRFDGAVGTDGEARILTAPLLADGTYPTLYVIGVATQDIANGTEGFITTYGKVREFDTTGTSVGESWSVGDILYANPNYVGKLTKVKPTAPDNCIPIAAVLIVDAVNGEIFVRPTIDQRMIYGRFSDTTNQNPLVINTPYAITFDTTNISNGVTRGTPTSRIVVDQSGFYEVKASLSLTSTNSSAKAFFCWIRKNGVDVPYSARRKSITGNGTYDILTRNFAISLDANDYIEIMYAVNDITISVNSPPATAFCPAIPSATLTVTQVAL